MYTITIMDCLRAVQRAKEANFFNFEDFDYEEYEHYEKVQVRIINELGFIEATVTHFT